MSPERITAQGASLTLHFVVLSSLLWLARPGMPDRAEPRPLRDVNPLWLDLGGRAGGGGGGDRSETAASRGRLPSPSTTQLAPPSALLRNLAPELPVEPTLLALTDLPLRNLGPLGDPSGVAGPPSNGPGSGGGIGPGKGGGVGPGNGPGTGPGGGGGITSSIYRLTDGVVAPQLVHRVEPEFTEEARKARYQGSVRLRVIVGADGLVRGIELVRAAGFGLDERAMEAVKQWRFRPGTVDGRPVSVEAAIEVTFRLL